MPFAYEGPPRIIRYSKVSGFWFLVSGFGF